MFSTIGYWICYPFAALVRLFYNTTGSYGVSLILFTLVVKLVILPFMMKSKRSMIRMNLASAELRKIQERYANNRQKMAEEQQKLYEEQGINPMSGCLWSFLPMPILIALYYIIRCPIVYFMNFGSKANGLAVLESARNVLTGIGVDLSNNAAFEQIEIVGQIARNSTEPAVANFLSANPNWVSVNYKFLGMDLSTSASTMIANVKNTGVTGALIGVVLMVILAAGSQVLVSKVAMMGQDKEMANSGTNRLMMLMMPLMTLWIGYTLPAALSLYWVAQSVFSIIQEYFLGKFFISAIKESEAKRQAAIDEDRKRRQEEARNRQREEQAERNRQQQLNAQKKLAAQQGGKAAKRSTTEAGRVGDRPYARGRAYRSHEEE